MAFYEFLYIAGAIATLVYLFAKYNYSYWDRKGFKTYPGVSYLFGHLKSVFLQQKNLCNVFQNIYRNTNEPFIGIYSSISPILLIRDPDVVRNILVKDFSNFVDRGVYCDEKNDPLSGHLFSLSGEKWKNLRAKLTPAFTTGKLKTMFPIIAECGKAVQKFLDERNGQSVDIRDLSARMTINVITSVAFGVDVDSINNPNTEFRKCGQKIFEQTLKNGIRVLLLFTAPKLLQYLPLKSVDQEVEDFICSVVQQNLEHREKNNVDRKDFFQCLVQLRNKGSVQLDDEWQTEIKTNANKMSVEEMAANVFLFFAAGYETSSSTMSFCLYELAKNPEIQKKVHDDIDRVLKRHNGEITYESVSEMKYLECCIDETLRVYPPLPLLNRKCLKDYPIPGTNKIIEKGMDIAIPVFSIQRDSRFYPEPEKFMPERFDEENSNGKTQANRPYMPFGDGPRICIGLRLGKLQTKIGLLLMLKEFKFEIEANKSNSPIVFAAAPVVLAPIDGIKLRVSKRG